MILDRCEGLVAVNPTTKVVINSIYLRGSGTPGYLQLVGTVFVEGTEFRVMAPAGAEGDSRDWLEHCSVRTSVKGFYIGDSGEIDAEPDIWKLAIEAVRAELEKQRGMNSQNEATPVEPYYHALIHTVKEPKIEAKFDLRRNELEQRILGPYRDLRPIILGGRTIPAKDLTRVAIFQSERSSDQFQSFTKSNARSGVREWFFGEPDVREISDELITTPSIPTVPQNADAIELLCARFHLVSKQLRDRRENRPTLDIADEYDVQDLLHALLWVFFEDVRKEVWTPNYAGRASRVDFLLPDEQIVIETKKTRVGLGAKELGDELLIDIAHYKEFQSCKRLICFVYDPDERIVNPRGLEHDLSRKEADFEVKTMISPRRA